MLNGKFVSVEPIIEGAYINAGYQSIDEAEALFHIGRAISKLISPSAHVMKITDGSENNVERILIENFRALLPRDLKNIVAVRDANTKIAFVYDTNLHYLNPSATRIPSNEVDASLASTETAQITPTINPTRFVPAYRVNDDYIFTNINNVELEISYTAYAVDSRGWPMIPDDDMVREAIEKYLIERLDYKAMRQGKISQNIYAISQRDAHFAMAQAITHIATPNADQMQSILHSWTRMIPNLNSHSYGFANEMIPERRRIH